MRDSAASFAVRGDSPARVARALADTTRGVARPAGGLVFAGGPLSARTREIASAISRLSLGFPVLVASGAGVLTERGEIEGEPAGAGLVWSGGECVSWVRSGSGDEPCVALGQELAERERPGREQTALIFVRPGGIQPHSLEALAGLRATRVFGAGTVGEGALHAVDRAAHVSSGAAGALVISGLTPPLLRASPACRLLMPLREITATHGSMVLSIEDEPALEVLSAVARDLADHPLVFVALSNEAQEHEDVAPALVLRAVQGVDPSRHGLVVSEEVRKGMRMAFAVRDAVGAKLDLEAAAREVEQRAAGAAPRFGIYLNCSGRGAALYQTPDVDTRILRARFPDVPWVGLQSSFEIAPHAGRPTLQLYSGVIGLFTAPS